MLLSTTTDNMIGVGVGPHDVPDDVGSGRDLGAGGVVGLGVVGGLVPHLSLLHQVKVYGVVLLRTSVLRSTLYVA